MCGCVRVKADVFHSLIQPLSVQEGVCIDESPCIQTVVQFTISKIECLRQDVHVH